jgi:hypothetical protein
MRMISSKGEEPTSCPNLMTGQRVWDASDEPHQGVRQDKVSLSVLLPPFAWPAAVLEWPEVVMSSCLMNARERCG